MSLLIEDCKCEITVLIHYSIKYDFCFVGRNVLPLWVIKAAHILAQF